MTVTTVQFRQRSDRVCHTFAGRLPPQQVRPSARLSVQPTCGRHHRKTWTPPPGFCNAGRPIRNNGKVCALVRSWAAQKRAVWSDSNKTSNDQRSFLKGQLPPPHLALHKFRAIHSIAFMMSPGIGTRRTGCRLGSLTELCVGGLTTLPSAPEPLPWVPASRDRRARGAVSPVPAAHSPQASVSTLRCN